MASKQDFAALKDLVTRRAKVEFLSAIEELEAYAETGMRAVLTSFRLHDEIVGEEYAAIGVDYEPFDEHNRVLETPNYNGPNGTLVGPREGGFYDPQDTLYVSEWKTVLRPLDDARIERLQKRYLSERQEGEAYLAFLERAVDEQR